MARNYLRELSYNCITNLGAGCDLSFYRSFQIFYRLDKLSLRVGSHVFVFIYEKTYPAY